MRRLSPIRALAALALTLSFVGPTIGRAQEEAPVAAEAPAAEARAIDPERAAAASAAADRFAESFLEHLDIGPGFDYRFASGAIAMHKRERWFTEFLGIPKRKEFDDAILARGYQAVMNLVYLSVIYTFHKELRNLDHDSDLPPEIAEQFKSSDFFSDGIEGAVFNIGTREELEQFIGEATLVAELYRQILARPEFSNEENRAALRDLMAEHSEVSVKVGSSNFKRVKGDVYVVQRGLFQFEFVEEDGQMRILFLEYVN